MRMSVTLLSAMRFNILVVSFGGAAWADATSVAPFQPNIPWGARTVAVDVSTANTAVAIAASETGGL